MAYNLNNPHPGFGKDKNIINEFGHTAYPKWVVPSGEVKKDRNGLPIKVLVKDAAEEAEVTGKKPSGKVAGWKEPEKTTE